MSDQNKHKKQQINTVVDAIDESSFLTELERIGARAGRTTAARSELEQRIKSEGKLLNKLLEEGERHPIIKEGPFYAEQVAELRESIKNIRQRINIMESSAITRAESEASTFISRQFSPSAINVQSSTIMRQPTVQNRAFTMVEQSYEELEARREEILASIRQTERIALNEVKGMFGRGGQVRPESSAALGAIMSGTRERIAELATINVAQQLQRISGIDPMSKMRNIAEMGRQAEQVLTAEQIAQEISRGGINIMQGGKQRTVANEDIQQEIINQARQLADALKELKDGVNKTDEELAKLRETAEESAENMEKLQQAQNMGGGGRGISGSQIASAFAGGFGVIGNAAQQILVAQRLGQVNNIAGFANLANQQYEMYRMARSGNIMAQLTLEQLTDVEDFAEEISVGTKISQGLYAAGGAAQAAAGALQMKEAALQKANPLAYATGASTQNTAAVIQGGLNTAQGIATTAVVGMDMLRGVTSGQAMIEAAQAQIRARQALMYVSATQMQGLRDYYTQLDIVAQGAGGRARDFLSQAMSDENMEAMISARLSPEQFAQMSQLGFEQIGSTFNRQQIYAARNLERAGFGNMQLNLQRMAILAGAGINNPQAGLEDVISAAMTKGLDNSKVLNLMVENTAAMVKQSEITMAAGIDTTKATAALIMGNVDVNQPNKEFALSRAVTAQQAIEDITTDVSVSYTGMVNVARIQRETGLSQIDSMFAARLTTAELRSFQEVAQQDQEKAREALLMRGINVTTNIDEFIKTMLRLKTEQAFTGSGALAYGTNEIRESLVEKALKNVEYSELSAEEKSFLGRIGGNRNLTGLEYYTTVRGIQNTPINVEAKGAEIAAGRAADDLKVKLDELRTSGFKQAAEAADFASKRLKEFGGEGGALEIFTQLQKIFETRGIENEKIFSEAAQKMATDFSVSATKFDEATNKYKEASEAIIKIIKAMDNKNYVVPSRPTIKDDMNKLKGTPSR